VQDSPAFQAGLQLGELLESIDEQPLDGLELSNVVSMLRGPPGSSIKVEVSRKLTGSTTMLPLAIVMTRGAIADQGEDDNKMPLEGHRRDTSNQSEVTDQAAVSAVYPLTDDFGNDEENCFETMPGFRGLARVRALHLLRLNRTRQAEELSSQSVPPPRFGTVTLTGQRLSNDFGIAELTNFVVQRERDGACPQSPNASAKAFTPLGETARAEWQQDGCDPFLESALSWAEASDITPSTLVTSASDTADTTSAPDMVETISYTYDASERVIYDTVTSAPEIYDSVSVIFDDVHFAHGMDNVLVPQPTYQEALSPGMRPALHFQCRCPCCLSSRCRRLLTTVLNQSHRYLHHWTTDVSRPRPPSPPACGSTPLKRAFLSLQTRRQVTRTFYRRFRERCQIRERRRQVMGTFCPGFWGFGSGIENRAGQRRLRW
jgi:hypothetical protein